MALKQLYRTHSVSLQDLDADGFTKVNFDSGDISQTTRITADAPKGVLGGSVACIKGDNLVGSPDTTNEAPLPVGLFINDAAGKPYQNLPAEASGKNPYNAGAGSIVAIDVYETKTKAGANLTAYAAGDKLYCSHHGLLTNEVPDGTNDFNDTLVAVVITAPTGADPFMVVKQEI